MKTGVTLFLQNYTDWERHHRGDWETDPKIPDSQIYDEEIRLGDLVPSVQEEDYGLRAIEPA